MIANLPIDQSVRERAMTRLDTSFFLQAGAGTGKTAVLVGRIVEAVRIGRAQLREIVAITFTEKAAGELRDRVRRALYQALRAADGAEAQRLREALDQVDGAHIETIHAFASSLLRERPLEAGLDPNFTVLDALSEQLVFDQDWQDWLWTEADSAARPRIERCLRLGLPLGRLRDLTHQIAESRDLDPRQSAAAPSPPQSVYAELRRRAETLRTLADAAGAARETEALLESLQRAEGLPAVALEGALTTLTYPRPRLGRKSGDAKIRYGEAARLFDEGLAAYAEQVRAHALAEFIEVAYAFVQQAAEQRRRRGGLSFTDLLIEARTLLVHEPAVRDYFRKRFSFLLIDEFQDTDPLQAEIVLLLTSRNPTADWREAEVLPGRLFIVGDPKQSIYRFRRADIDIYNAVEAIFRRQNDRTPGAAQVDVLEVNFRSRPRLVEWHNQIFRVLIRRQPDFPHAQPDYQPLTAHREDEGFAVVHLLPNTGVSWRKVGEAREDEARAIVRFIETIVNTDELPLLLPDRSAESGRRAPRYRDVCLLVRNRTELEIYTNQLEQAGIPYHLDSGRGFFLQQEIRDAAAILTALDDPSDEVAVVGALKSAPFAASDLELLEFAHASAGRTRRFHLTEEMVGDYQGPLRPAVDLLLRLKERKARLPLPAFVDHVLRETHLLDIQLALKKPQRAANLHLVVQRAADFAANEVDSLRPFVRWLSTQSRPDLAEAEWPVTEVEDDVVRILTIHQAKGLEFPIVILAKMAGGEAPDRSIAVVNRQAGTIDFQVGKQGQRFQSPGFAQAQARQVQYDKAEERRLLYVAATRARDYLVLPAFFTERALGYHADLEEALPGWINPDYEVTAPGAVTYRVEHLVQARRAPPSASPPPVAKLLDQWQTAHAAAQERGAVRRRFAAPSQIGHDAPKEARETEPRDRAAEEVDRHLVTEGGARPGGMGEGESLFFSTAAGDGRVRGTLLHDALRLADFSDPEAAAWRARHLCQERARPDLGNEIERDLRTTLASALFQRVRAAEQVERELPLVLVEADQTVEGYVDLAFREPEGWVLVDYKSDRDPSAATLAGYEEQVRAYVRCFRGAGATVADAYLLLTATGEGRPVPLP